MSPRVSHIIPITVSLIFALVVFFIQMQGFKIVDPTFTGWLRVLNSDYSIHFMGWEYFRHQPWTWPLGQLEQYAYPMVSSIGYTDSIPICALFFKVFNGMLPEQFQYFGLWLLGCYLLQAFFGYKIGLHFSKNQRYAVMCSILFVLAAPLLFRTPHPALCGHWLILASLYYYLHRDLRTSVVGGFLITSLAALIHPYLMVMCIGLCLASFFRWRILQKIGWLRWTGLSLSVLALVYGLLYATGYFIIQSEQAVGLGLGEFSANLNTLVNPQGLGRMIPTSAKAFEGQYEGFAYLGAGGLIISVLAIREFIIHKQGSNILAKNYWPLAIAVLVFSLLAMFPILTIGSKQLLSLDIGGQLFNTFRSSGRFIWVLHYSVLIFAVHQLAKFKTTNQASVLLIAAIGFQSYDLWPLISRPILEVKDHPSALHETWHTLFQEVETVYLYPPYQASYASNGDVQHFIRLGAQTQTNVSAGNLARRDDRIADSLYTTIPALFDQAGPFPKSSIYVLGLKSLPLMKTLLDRGAGQLLQLQDYLVYFPEALLRESNRIRSLISSDLFTSLDGLQLLRLEEWMGLDTSAYYLLSVKDEASRMLCDETRQDFSSMTSVLAKLEYRESYIGVHHNGQVIQEQKGMEGLNIELALNNIPIQIFSGGADAENLSSIKIGEVEHSLNARGINIVKLNQAFQVDTSICFDTYEQCEKAFRGL